MPSDTPAVAHLPRENLRDYLNELTLDLKFRWIPFRAYYRFRAYKYLYRTDPEMGILKFLVDRNRVSLDLGANLGLFTYFLARYSREVYAFEPNPLPYNVLKDIVDRNVVVRQMAITDSTGEVELVVRRTGRGWTKKGARIDRSGASTGCIVRVPGSSIDDLGLKDIGFIKMDVEGHELAVLNGALATLNRDKPNLFIENEYVHAGEKASEVFRVLENLGYEGFFLRSGTLTHLHHFSFEQHQITPWHEPGGGASYVRNFIFLPR